LVLDLFQQAGFTEGRAQGEHGRQQNDVLVGKAREGLHGCIKAGDDQHHAADHSRHAKGYFVDDKADDHECQKCKDNVQLHDNPSWFANTTETWRAPISFELIIQEAPPLHNSQKRENSPSLFDKRASISEFEMISFPSAENHYMCSTRSKEFSNETVLFQKLQFLRPGQSALSFLGRLALGGAAPHPL